MPQLDGSIRIGTEITTKDAVKELKSLESSISKTADKIASLRSKMDSLKDAKLPTDEYKAIQNQIDITEKKINDLLARQEKFLATDGKKFSSAYQRMQYDIDELKASLPYLKSELQDLVESGQAFTLGSDTEEYAQTAAQIEQLNQQMQADTLRQTELQSALADEEKRLADIKANASESDRQMISLSERRKQLTKEIADMEKAGLGYGYQEYDSARQEHQIREYKDNLDTVPERFSQMRQSAQRAFGALSGGISKSSGLFSLLKNSADKTFRTVSKGARQSTGLLSAFASRLKGLAASAFIFNLLSKGFNSMVSSMRTGFTNLMGYSGSFANSIQSVKNSLSTLGNQIAAAFAPIVQAVIPWLNQLISVISTAMSYVAQFIAALTGRSSYVRAKKVQDSYNASLGDTSSKAEDAAGSAGDMADSLDDTAKAAKKARSALAAFDDLDVLEKQDESTDAAADKIKDLGSQLKDLGSGAGGGIGDLFEEVPVENRILDMVERLKDLASQLFEPLKKAWKQEGEFVMKAWKFALKEVWQLMKDIGRDFLVMWNQEATIKMFADVLHIVGDIGLTIGNIAYALDEAWDKNQTGLHILENIRDIFAVIIRNIREAADFTVEWSKTLDFSPLFGSIERFTRALVPFADFVSGTLSDFYTQFILPLTSWALSEDGIPRLINVLGDFMDAVDWEALRASLKDLYSALEPYAEAIGGGLIDFIEKIKNFGIEFLNSLPEPIQKLADVLKAGDPEKIRAWTSNLLEFAIAIEGLKLAFKGFGIIETGFGLFGAGGMASSMATTASEAAGGITMLSAALGYLSTMIEGVIASSVLIDPFLNDLGAAAGANEKQINTLSDRYDGLGGKINVVKDFLSVGSNAMEGFGFNASNTANQIGALETVMDNIADGMIYTDAQLEKLRTRFGFTDDDIEMLRQAMLDANEPLRQLADDFGLLDASAETLQGVSQGMELVRDGTVSAAEAFDEFSKPMWGMNDKALEFFQNLSDGRIALDDYASGLSSTSEAVNQFSNDITEAGENISDGITKGFEKADVSTPVHGFFDSVIESLASVFDMHSPAKNMEPYGENIFLGVVKGFKGAFSYFSDIASELWGSYVEPLFSGSKWAELGGNIKTALAETWTSIQNTAVNTWMGIQNWFSGFWSSFTNKLCSVWNDTIKFFTETWQNIKLTFQAFIDLLNWTVVPAWKEGWSTAENIFKSFADMLNSIVNTITLMLDTFFSKTVKSLIDIEWKSVWENAKNIFTSFKDKIVEITNVIKGILESFFGWISDTVSKIISSINDAGSAAGGLEKSVNSNGRSATPAMASYPAQSFAALTNDLPHLASGSVIRGGNPFIAMLGDQPRGQVNVEAPLATIEQAVENAMSRNGYRGGQVPVTINLNWDGETFARLSISDILSELSRQGYNVNVLGVT